MCGISSGISGQPPSFLARFDQLLAILLVLGGRAYVGEPGQKVLKNPKVHQKSPKVKKSNQISYQNVRNFVRNAGTTFFFDFGRAMTHFRPFSWAVGPI